MATFTTPSGKPLSKGQIIVGIICALMLLGMIGSALGLDKASPSYCNSTRNDMVNGHSNNAAVQKYQSDCR